MIIWIAPVLGFLRTALPYALLFLRSIPDLIAPKPTPVSTSSPLPYTGGQCVGFRYEILVTVADNGVFNSFTSGTGMNGAIVSITKREEANGTGTIVFTNSVPDTRVIQTSVLFSRLSWRVDSLTRTDGQPDNCGNVTTPVSSPPIPNDGLFNPTNPRISDDNGTLNPAAIVLAPALPLVFVSAVLAGYSAAMAAAQTALSALDATRKIAEGLDALKTLWEKLKEFLDEWEKNRPSKRDIVRQTYGRISGDGALDFFPDNNTKFQAIQLDVVITNIPVGFGRYFGSLSPSRYRYRELGYIAFYSVNQGILSTHSIQFKRTSYQIPELAIGFIYHLGLDEQIKGYAFGTFSVEKT